jgi:hypothetical protein
VPPSDGYSANAWRRLDEAAAAAAAVLAAAVVGAAAAAVVVRGDDIGCTVTAASRAAGNGDAGAGARAGGKAAASPPVRVGDTRAGELRNRVDGVGGGSV